MTDNGFRLDLAMSRYLKVNIKREVLKDSADRLIEDTRFNSPAKDGTKYTDDGIYTITVQNEYTNQLTVKKIYVGTNSVLRAYMTTGLSIPEINSLLAQGATISDDGTIQLASITPPAEQPGEDENPLPHSAVSPLALFGASKQETSMKLSKPPLFLEARNSNGAQSPVLS